MDYIPAKDSDFAAWLLNLAVLVTALPATYGLTAPDAVIITAQSTAFSDALTAATDPATRTAPTVAAKDAARAAAEFAVRPFAVSISLNADVTNEAKAAAGVTIRSTTPTPVPAPVVAPALSFVSAIPGQTTLQAKQPGSTGKAKPAGVIGIEVRTSVGTVAATDPEQLSPAGTYGKTPFLLTFGAPESGKVCTVAARYITRSGPAGVSQSGPWSALLSFNLV